MRAEAEGARAGSAPGGTPVPPRPWPWPLDVTRYDRTPALAPAERRALIQLGPAVRGWRGATAPPWTALGRLVTPLADARAALDVGPAPAGRVADAAVGEVLHACGHGGRPYWAWTPATWLEVIGVDVRAYRTAPARMHHRYTRPDLIALAYLFDGVPDLGALGACQLEVVAAKVFGRAAIAAAITAVGEVLHGWGYAGGHGLRLLRRVLPEALLRNRSPRLTDLSVAGLTAFAAVTDGDTHRFLGRLHRALAAMGLLAPPAAWPRPRPCVDGVDPVWSGWVLRWEATSPLTPRTRRKTRHWLLRTGRWLAATHPDIREPGQWDRPLCAEWVAAVDRLKVGDYAITHRSLRGRVGQPFGARAKHQLLGALRGFLRDGQEWGWIPSRLDPTRTLATPRSIMACIGPDPRVIADAIWAKLLWAGLHLEAADLPGGGYYPLPLVRALALTWLFAGLRSNEIVRLRVGCVRWQRADPAGADVCLLDIPVTKTSTAFTKPVDPLLGHALAAWTAVRPPQPLRVDGRTSEPVALLFSIRARPVAVQYLNDGIIPILCRKAGVPLADARGRITSHRARSTIASQLYNAKEPMTLFQLQAWLGHRSPLSTQHYARITPTTLAQAYRDAGYFARNVRAIEVLIDRDAVEAGTAGAGHPWQFFDLGHGYCTYSFFEQCPHRMACARCDFYVPKASTRAQLHEAMANLQRMTVSIPLTDEERAAVDDGQAALARLLERLADVPTPAGPTPRSLTFQPLPMVPSPKGLDR